MTNGMFQLGTRAIPCKVLFGLSDRFDLGKAWRSISVSDLSPEAVLVLDGFVKSDKNGFKYVTIKISEKETVMKADLCRGDAVMLAIVQQPWKFAGKSGVCLRAMAIEKIEKPLQQIVFIY